MRAGKLRSKINILREKRVKSTKNGEMLSRLEPYLKNVYCDDRVVSSRDNMRNGLELSEEIHTILIRYNDNILSTDIIELSDGRRLRIEGRPRPNDQKKREMIITAIWDGKDVQ